MSRKGAGKESHQMGEANLAMRDRFQLFLVFLCLFCCVVLTEGRTRAIEPGHTTVLGENKTEQDQSVTQPGQTFYKWTDEAGNLFLTDDPTKIPERYRGDAEILELPPLSEVKSEGEQKQESVVDESPPPVPAIPRGDRREIEEQRQISRDPYTYKEVPFDQFIRITVGMDEAEVLSRLGFPTLITPSDYFYGDRARYRSRIIRFIYLGERAQNQKTSIVEIRDGKVINTERIFP